MNKALLVEKVRDKGFTLENFATELGMNYTTLYRKLNGESEFTRPEIRFAKNILGLNSKEMEYIFFSD